MTNNEETIKDLLWIDFEFEKDDKMIQIHWRWSWASVFGLERERIFDNRFRLYEEEKLKIYSIIYSNLFQINQREFHGDLKKIRSRETFQASSGKEIFPIFQEFQLIKLVKKIL